jgi:hypothetical protein
MQKSEFFSYSQGYLTAESRRIPTFLPVAFYALLCHRPPPPIAQLFRPGPQGGVTDATAWVDEKVTRRPHCGKQPGILGLSWTARFVMQGEKACANYTVVAWLVSATPRGRKRDAMGLAARHLNDYRCHTPRMQRVGIHSQAPDS